MKRFQIISTLTLAHTHTNSRARPDPKLRSLANARCCAAQNFIVFFYLFTLPLLDIQTLNKPSF